MSNTVLEKSRILLEDVASLFGAKKEADCADQAEPRRVLELTGLEDRLLFSATPISPDMIEGAGGAGIEQEPAMAPDADGALVVGWGTENQEGDDWGLASEVSYEETTQEEDDYLANLTPEETQLADGPDVATTEGNDFVFLWDADVDANLDSGDQTADAVVRRELVFVDTGAEDYQQLLEDLIARSEDGRQLEVVLLDSNRDGVEQISEVLSGYADVDAVHFVSHGEGGTLKLGNTWLSLDSLNGYAGEIAGWNDALRDGADMLIYGCDLAASEDGQTLTEALGVLCDCDVAASDDDTGHARYGGDWDLEYTTGTIETAVAFSSDVQQDWVGKLAVINVDTFNDVVDGGDGLTSLREAILQVNAGAGGDTIILSAGTYTLSLGPAGDNNGDSGDLDILKSVTITGAGAQSTIIDGNGLDRVFHIQNASTVVTMSGVTIQGGAATDNGAGVFVDNSSTLNLSDAVLTNNNGTGGRGGALHVHGTLNLDRVLVYNNWADEGAGIYFHGAVAGSLTNVTISGNTAFNEGGGLWTDVPITVTNSTIAFNTAPNGGGVVDKDGMEITIKNSILHNPGSDNSDGVLTSGGNNIDSDGTAGLGDLLDGVDPMLAALRDNGGPTQTHALLAGSPAINAGTNSGAPTVDARNVARDDGMTDIGAFENVVPTLTATGSGSIVAGATYLLSLSATDPGNDTITSWTINWGDGTIETIAGNPSSATHVYTNTGFTNNIMVSATDEGGTYIPGDVLITSNDTDSLFRFDATTGGFVDEFGDFSGLANPVDIEIGPDGLVYATGFISDDVRRYDPVTGAFIDQLVSSNSGGLNQAARMAFGPDGNLYVTSYSTDEVLRYDGATGAFIDAFVTAGSGTLDQADGITFGPDGNLYVASNGNGKILQYDGETGAFLGTFASVGSGGYTNMEFGPDGHLYVANVSLNKVQRFDGTTGAYIDDFVTAGSGGISGTGGLEFGPDGDLYVVGFNSDNVMRYDGTTGAFLDEYIAAGSGQNNPINLAFMPAHQVTVTPQPVTATNDAYVTDEDTVLNVLAPGVLANDNNGFADPTPGYSLNYDVDQDTDGDNVWQNTTAASGFDWNLDPSVIHTTTPNTSLSGIDTALVFDGSGGATMQTLQNLSGDPSANSASFELWFNPSDASGIETLFEAGGTGSGVSLTLNGSALDFTVFDGSASGFATADISAEIAANEFIQVVGVIDLDSAVPDMYLYVNGTPVASDIDISSLSDWSNPGNCGLGKTNAGIASFTTPTNYQGEIAVFRFYETALSDTDVKNNYDTITTGTSLTATNLDTTGTVGSVALNLDGSFVYTPAPGWSGVDSFSYTADDGTSTDTATVSITVNPVSDAPVGVPTIMGTVEEDQLLTADTSGISDEDGLGPISYQWQRDGVNIGGATGSTYTLTQVDVGATITVVASYTDGEGTSESVTSAGVGPVANLNDAPTGSVTISGTPTEDQVLTVANTLADEDGLGTISYQWQRDGVDIGGATSTTYILTQADVDTSITVVASYTDGEGTSESVTSAGVGPVANVNDAPTGSVTISGTPIEDQTLTAGNTLADEDGLGTVSYQWQRGGVDIGGATSSTYTLTQADVGTTITVVASYTDGQGTGESVTSASVGPVANVNDAPAGSVTISGTPTENQVLTAANTVADEDGLGPISYQWQRGGVDIGGATASTYTLTQADVGATITVVASYTDGQGTSESVTSAGVGPVANVNDAPTGSVTISGTPTEDQVLSAGNTLADEDGLGTISYQWQRDGVDIGGATASTYTLTQSDVGATITVVASYTDGEGTSESVTSAGVGPVANVNDAPTGSVTISGTPTEDQVLTAANTLADEDGLGPISYQWQRGGVDIGGATASTYTLTQADVGATITVVASYTDGQGTSESVTSAGVGPVANVNDAPTGSVTISGTPTEDQVLTVANTLADEDGLGPISYQWQRGGVDIAGAMGSSYTLTQADVGTTITVVASYTDGQGTSESVSSAGVGPVVNLNDAPTGSVTISGTPTEDQVLSAANTLADEDGLGPISHQWQRDGVDIGGATSGTYTLTQADVGTTITVVASYTDGEGTNESVTSAGAGPVANVNDAPAGAVTISGTPTEDQVLTATNTLADEDGLGPVSHQWQRDAVDIGGATSGTYTLTQTDVGTTITVVASYTDGQGTSESVTSAGVGPVANVNDAPAGAVTISGTPTEDQVLTAANTLADEDGLGPVSYQWQRDGVDIGGATASAYTLTQTDVGTTITVVASYTDGEGTSESVTSAGVGPVANVNDAPTGSVTISGTPTEDQVLTATNTLADEDGLGPISYQWQRGGVDIGGAASSTYTLTQADVGTTITVVASYTDGQGTSESATSAGVGPVANLNDAPTGSVTISGTPTEDQTLTAANTLADEDGLGPISYQWQRDGVDIGGVTASTYTLTQADVGTTITVVASYTDGEGTSENVTSSGVGPVVNVNDMPTGSVTISGTPTEDQVLTAANTLADEDGLGPVSYQWQRDGVDIGGATASAYTLTQTDVGTTITVVASYTDGEGTNESVTSAGVGPVANVNDAPAGAVTISGTPAEDQVLTAANTLADEDGLGPISYQWQRDGVDIGGAASSTYTLTQADVGTTITVVASYTDGQGTSESATSAGVGPVANLNDAPTGSVTISGTPTEDQVLTAANTLADEDGLGTISYQWQRDSVDIGGATSGTYNLTQTDVGTSITVVASYTDGQGTGESVTSAGVGPVANLNHLPVAAGNTVSTTVDTSVLISAASLLANDTDVDLDTLSIASFSQPANGTVVDNGDGTFLYTPTTNFSGADSFTYTVNDGNGGSDTAIVTVTVGAPNSPLMPLPPDAGNGDEPAASEPDGDHGEDSDEDDEPVAEILPQQKPAIPDADNNPLTRRPFAQRETDTASFVSAPVTIVQATTDMVHDPFELGQLFQNARLPGIARTIGHVVTAATLPSSLDFIYDVGGFLSDLDSFKDSLSFEFSIPRWAAGSVLFTTTSLSVGYVMWTIRGGYLVASALSSIPAWALIDPLPVLEYLDDSEDSEKRQEQDDKESLDSIIDNTIRDQGSPLEHTMEAHVS